MNKRQSKPTAASSQIDLLEAIWKRHTFHDCVILSMKAINRRVIIGLEEYTLVICEVTAFSRQLCELPAVWLYHKWLDRGSGFALQVETECGQFEITGADLRLIRNADCAILIPAIDR